MANHDECGELEGGNACDYEAKLPDVPAFPALWEAGVPDMHTRSEAYKGEINRSKAGPEGSVRRVERQVTGSEEEMQDGRCWPSSASGSPSATS